VEKRRRRERTCKEKQDEAMEDASKARMISKDRSRREKHGGTEEERGCGSMRSTRMRRRRMQGRQGW